MPEPNICFKCLRMAPIFFLVKVPRRKIIIIDEKNLWKLASKFYLIVSLKEFIPLLLLPTTISTTTQLFLLLHYYFYYYTTISTTTLLFLQLLFLLLLFLLLPFLLLPFLLLLFLLLPPLLLHYYHHYHYYYNYYFYYYYLYSYFFYYYFFYYYYFYYQPTGFIFHLGSFRRPRNYEKGGARECTAKLVKFNYVIFTHKKHWIEDTWRGWVIFQ